MHKTRYAMLPGTYPFGAGKSLNGRIVLLECSQIGLNSERNALPRFLRCVR